MWCINLRFKKFNDLSRLPFKLSKRPEATLSYRVITLTRNDLPDNNYRSFTVTRPQIVELYRASGKSKGTQVAPAIRIQRPFPLATSPARPGPALKVALLPSGFSVATLRADKQEIVCSRFETFPGKFASCRGRRTRGEPVASVWWSPCPQRLRRTESISWRKRDARLLKCP